MSKRDIILECYFSFKLALYISLYLRIAKLSLLECFIFHLGPIEPSVKLKKITRNQGRLGLLESYDPIDPE